MSLSFLHRPLVFVRHGQTAWNATRLVMGQIDIPLDPTGEAQAAAAAAEVAALPVTSVWCSPLGRCRATAAALLALRPDLPLTVLDDLAERHWGIHQGGDDRLRPPRHHTPPEGESAAAFAERTLRALAAVDDAGLPVVVAHSGTFRVVLDLYGRDSDGPPVANGAPILLTVDGPKSVKHLHPKLQEGYAPDSNDPDL
ncbi:histidine phosphatase family protein [Caenispirillum bisanense]|uniref:histidine phosphatase family protein n=1 Tax=Caenispirillum bisanense TaxID=414052 RepID=UPI0031DC137A